MNEEQLRALNCKVIERLKLISRVKSAVSMKDFNLMDRVYFNDKGKRVVGTIIRLNQKSVSVKTDDGHDWLISPCMLTKIIEPEVNPHQASRNDPCYCGSGKKYKKCCR